MKSIIKQICCDNCDNLFSKRISLVKPNRFNYCSNNCRRSDKRSSSVKWTDERRKAYSEKIKGENNPNFGKKWSDEQKKKFSIKKISFFAENEEHRIKCGNANRGKVFSAERITRMHAGRDSGSYGHQGKLSEQARLKISKSSKERNALKEYKLKIRKTKELAGQWVPLDEKDPFKIYYSECNWINSMFKFMDSEVLDRIKIIGMFNSKTNRIGLVRDHIVSRKTGFSFKVPPLIMRHPENLQVLSHSDNAKKGHADKKINEHQNLRNILDLMHRITHTKFLWQEQHLTLQQIEEYYEYLRGCGYPL